MKKKLLLLSFIEGAAVMAAELCGAKLLAPIFGSSLYVWASIMGITLAALALGYFFGGWLSEKSEKHNTTLFQVLSLAALCLLFMPVVSFYLVPRISYLSFLNGVVLSSMVLLFLPIFFLATSSPLFISMQSVENSAPGKVSGVIYAVSTAGGIFSTFLCGFYLIPQIGLNACLISFGAILFFLNVLVFKMLKPGIFILFVFVSYMNFQVYQTKTSELFSSESMLGQLVVKDFINQNRDSVRILLVNNIIQTEMDLNSKKSLSDYMSLLDTLIPFSKMKKGKALVLGLGGGLAANLLVEKNYEVDGVELDKRIIKVAKDFFYLDKSVLGIDEDARYFLNKTIASYDVVLIDVFKAEEQPSHILTIESLKQLKKNLSDSSFIFINWHGYVNNNLGIGTSILYNTLTTAGFNVELCSKIKDENSRNIIFVASLNPLKNIPFKLEEELVNTTLVNSDNLPLQEKYNALANKTWRANYLRFYQQIKTR